MSNTIPLYVGSTSGYSGKSLISMGLGHRFKHDGLSIGFFKPMGILPIKVDNVLTDKDALFIYKLFELKDPLSDICPVVVTQELIVKAYLSDIKGLMGKITKSYRRLSQDKDMMVIGGSGSIHTGAVMNITGIKVIKRLNAKVIIVVKYEGDYIVDYLLQAKRDLGEKFMGVIINKVTPGYMESVKDYIVPFLKRKDIDTFGVIPHDSILDSITVEELSELLRGKILCCRDRVENLVENFLIGAVQADKATEYFKKSKGSAIIVGGDRADIQLSAIEANTRCLILTENLYPNDIIIARAEQNGVPIILVGDDTYDVAKRVERLSVRLRLRDETKVSHGIELVIENIDFQLLYKKLGIKR